MHKKSLSIGIVALLLLSTVMMTTPISAKPAPAGGVAIWVDPAYVNGTQVGLGNTFVVKVWINVSTTAGPVGSEGIFGFGIDFNWNDTLLTLVSYNKYAPGPVGSWEQGYTPAESFKDTDSNGIDDTHSWAAVASGSPPQAHGFTGPMVTSDYVFRVAYEPVFPEPTLSCDLALPKADFADVDADPITPVDKYEGLYEIFTGLPPKPQLEVKDPRDHDHLIERCDFPLGSKFNVTVCIKTLHAAYNLRAWEVKLSYDTSLLNVSTTHNGTFLENWANDTYYVVVTYEDLGYVHMGGVILGDPSKNPGTSPPMAPGYGPAQGVLITVEFLVTNVSVAPKLYQCQIGLYDTKLVNSTDQPIDHIVSADLKYEACYTTVGWFLDCFTDDWRKKCDPYYIGKGPNMTADAYEPQDLVILYANLTYNGEPEAYKMVTFEVHGPANSVYNITIFRTAWTNASGIATINFTIPGSGRPDWYTMVHGKWWCYQASQVKIYEKPTDWLFFEVGWIVELLRVEVTVPHPEGVEKGETIDITIYFKNIMMIKKHVVITICVLDVLLDPIQKDIYVFEVPAATYGPVEEFEPGLYASNPDPYEGLVTLNSTIPEWAHVGGLATLYVNAFTDIPSNCGCPYCPEIKVEFWVIKTGTGT